MLTERRCPSWPRAVQKGQPTEVGVAGRRGVSQMARRSSFQQRSASNLKADFPRCGSFVKMVIVLDQKFPT